MSTGNVLDAFAYISTIECSEGLVVDDAVSSGRVRGRNIVLRVLLLLLLLVLVLAHGEPKAVQIVDDGLMRAGVSSASAAKSLRSQQLVLLLKNLMLAGEVLELLPLRLDVRHSTLEQDRLGAALERSRERLAETLKTVT